MSAEHKADELSFWEHLDVLRAVIFRIAAVVVVCAVVAFVFKEQLFEVVLAPKDSAFITYRLLDRLGGIFSGEATAAFDVRLISTGLAQQFLIHAQTALYAGIVCASPYVLYELFRFISPALYGNERRYAVGVVGWGYLLFMTGVLVSYFLIFPLTFRFLGTYQVSADVANMITLESYIGTLVMLSLSMGIVFEMPILAWLLAKLGVLSSAFMRTYRRHALVVILIIAAIITPTSDIFTLLVVSTPMYLLYEASIWIVERAQQPKSATA